MGLRSRPGLSTTGLMLIAVGALNCSAVSGDSMFLIDGLAADPLLQTGGNARVRRIFKAGLEALRYDHPPRPPGLRLRNPFVPAGPSTSPPKELGSRMMRAERFLNRGQWDRALLEIEGALEDYPDNPYLLRRAAVLAALAGKYVAADGYFRRYYAIDPYNVVYLTGWADVLIRLNRFEEAWRLITRALAEDATYLPARFDYTLLRILREELQDIEAEWEELPPEMIPELSRLIRSQRDKIEPLVGKGVFRLLADVTLGAGTLGQAEEIGRRVREALEFLRKADWRRAEKALSDLHRFGLRSYKPEVRRSFCLFQMGEPRKAAAVLARLCRRYPQDGSLWYNLGFILAKMGRYAQAELVFRKAVELSPDNDDARFALSCTLAGQNKMEESFQILNRLAQSRPERMNAWLSGDAPYLKAIRADPRFAELKQRIAEAAERKRLALPGGG